MRFVLPRSHGDRHRGRRVGPACPAPLGHGQVCPAPARVGSTWANANLPGHLDCGYEDLPYTRLRQGSTTGGFLDLGRLYWTSSRSLPSEFALDPNSGWRLLREWEPGTRLLYECARDDEWNQITSDAGCSGLVPMGPVGYAWTAAAPGTIPLYACERDNLMYDVTHFVSPDAGCEGKRSNGVLGHVLPAGGM